MKSGVVANYYALGHKLLENGCTQTFIGICSHAHTHVMETNKNDKQQQTTKQTTKQPNPPKPAPPPPPTPSQKNSCLLWEPCTKIPKYRKKQGDIFYQKKP